MMENIGFETDNLVKKEIQNKIVNIMEEGQEDFMKRIQIYNLWKNE